MNSSKQNIKQTILASAMAATLGTATFSEQATAANLEFNISGWFTMQTWDGSDNLDSSDADQGAPMYGKRTAVTGTMTFDTDTNSGTMTIHPFPFWSVGNLTTTAITFQDTDGPGGASTLMLGNMSFNWYGSLGIPLSIVWDGKGILDAINQGLAVGNTIAATNADFACDTNISCATPATNDFLFNFGKVSYTLPIGASPITTTTWNTTTIGGCTLGCNPSGTLPLSDDGIGGSPLIAGPLPGYNINFDFDSIEVTAVSPEFISIQIPGGETQECTLTGGSDIPMSAKISVSENDEVDTVSWSLDGQPVASGESVVVTVPLGSHAVEVTVTTVLGSTFSNATGVTIEDTTQPIINATFLDSKTGTEITAISSRDMANLSIIASDVCDAAPSSIATAGLPVFDGDTVSARTSKKDSSIELSINGNADNIEVIAIAEDSSGNMSAAKTTLIVTQ